MSNSMTRKHFRAIAAGVRALPGTNIRERVATTLAPILAQFNSSFDRTKFIRACTTDQRREQ